MRILHPITLEIASLRKDIPKTVISHVWSEIFKWKASGKSHPKMFIDKDDFLGCYLALVYSLGKIKGCKLDMSKVGKLGTTIQESFHYCRGDDFGYLRSFKAVYPTKKFDDNYLFSDACSLYYKGINIFPDIFGDEWRKYVPVESREEIVRQCQKIINKK